MKQLTFTSNGRNWLLVGSDKEGKISCPKQEHREAGRLSSITEAKAFEIVDSYESSHNMDLTSYYAFRDYAENDEEFEDYGNYTYGTALESFESLIKSLGVHLQVNPVTVPMHRANNIKDFSDYLQAEKNIFYKPVLFELI